MKFFTKIAQQVFLCCISFSKRQRLLILWGIFLLALSLGILSSCAGTALSRDGALYLHLGEVWYRQGDITAMLEENSQVYIPPLLLWLITVFRTAGLDPICGIVGCNIILMSLLVFVVYYLASVISGNGNIAMVAALLTAIHPNLLELSMEIQREILYLFFSGMFLVLLFWGMETRRKIAWVLAALSLVLAVMSRHEALELIVLLFLSLISFQLTRKISKSDILWALGYFGGSFCLFFILVHLLIGVPIGQYYSAVIQFRLQALQ